ncbi:MAG: alpha/beta hydrolase [Proteobacteria bacterium]|nr:alpha/beta hydrolase [Pseudomonadota bacterium]
MAGLSLLLTGCVQLAVQQIVTPPAAAPMAYQADMEAHTGVTTATWQAPDGVQLAWRNVPAARRGFQYVFQRQGNGAGFDFELSGQPEPLPEVGTVVYLHGWGLDGASMLPWAFALSQQGWHGISVDLRHHGQSSPAPVGYGPREAADVAGLLTALRDQGRLKPPVFLLGVSYGATTALLTERALAGQVRGIIALQPYVNAADAVRAALRRTADASGPIGWLASYYSGGRLEPLIDAANDRLGLNLRAIDLRAAVGQSQTCTLILHGSDDRLLPAAASQALAAGHARVRYVAVPGHDHLTLPMRVDWLGPALADWMAAVGTGAGCPRDWQLPAEAGGAGMASEG